MFIFLGIEFHGFSKFDASGLITRVTGLKLYHIFLKKIIILFIFNWVIPVR
jgi:hypothetical protein